MWHHLPMCMTYVDCRGGSGDRKIFVGLGMKLCGLGWDGENAEECGEIAAV